MLLCLARGHMVCSTKILEPSSAYSSGYRGSYFYSNTFTQNLKKILTLTCQPNGTEHNVQWQLSKHLSYMHSNKTDQQYLFLVGSSSKL